MASFQDLLSTKAIQPQHPSTILVNASGRYNQLRSASHIAPEGAGRQDSFIYTRLPFAMQTSAYACAVPKGMFAELYA